MSGSIFIYNLPTTPEFLVDGYIPITNSEITRKIDGPNLREYIDKTVTLSNATSLAADDFIKVDSVSLGTRKAAVKNSIFYSVGTGSVAGPSELVKGNDVRLSDNRNPLYHSHLISDITDFNPSHYILTSSIGIPNGVVPLEIDGKISSSYIPDSAFSNPTAIDVSSVASNLVSAINVQGAINQLSDASYVQINATAANVIGTNSVQGALNQKLSLSGGTLTGNLFLPQNGLRVGTNDITISSNNVGIGISAATAKLDVNGTSRFRGDMFITGNSSPEITFANSDQVSNAFAIWRSSASDTLQIGPVSPTNSHSSAILFNRDRSVVIEKLIMPTNKIIQFGGQQDENSDRIQIARVNPATNRSELRIMIGDDPIGAGATAIDKFVIGTKNNNAITTPDDIVNNFRPVFTVNSDGSIVGGNSNPSSTTIVSSPQPASGNWRTVTVNNWRSYKKLGIHASVGTNFEAGGYMEISTIVLSENRERPFAVQTFSGDDSGFTAIRSISGNDNQLQYINFRGSVLARIYGIN